MIVCDNSWDRFPRDLLKWVFELVFESWDELVPLCTSDTSDRAENKKRHENRISRRLISEMRRKQGNMPVFIDSQHELLDEAGEIRGYIDIHVIPLAPGAVTFSFEAKRLNVRSRRGRRSEAGAYIDDGMRRFLSKQYAGNDDQGGMLGYVLDGDVPFARHAIISGMMKRRDDLSFLDDETAKPSSVLPEDVRIFESRHTRGRGGEFVIHHLMLSNTSE